MVDIHSHILANVDDGPENLDQTIEMLKVAIQEGITDIIATSHAYNPHYHVSKAAVEKKIKETQEMIEELNLPISIHTGQEIRVQDKTISAIENQEALTLAQSKYVLIELPSSSVPAYTIPIIQQLITMGHVPIIAHPERNKAIVEKPSRLERLISHGALGQVTAGSVSGHFGKNIQKASITLIKSNLIHFYGSDVHNLTTRPFLYNDGLNTMDKYKLSEYADLFLENNARILENKDPLILEPSLAGTRRWWNLFS